jgi:hypothetical protein
MLKLANVLCALAILATPLAADLQKDKGGECRESGILHGVAAYHGPPSVTGDPTTTAVAKRETRGSPIGTAVSTDPVAAGFVAASRD